MTVGPRIEDRSHVVGFREEIGRAAEASADEFFTWFDTAENAEASYVRGAWDFSHHILPLLVPHVRQPENLIALEIGCGGGRLLAAASRHFRNVVGVDIHDRLSFVAEHLRAKGVANFELHQSGGNALPVPDASIDVIYSFTVIQHMEHYETVTAYLRDAFRACKHGGVAVLYFGRPALLSANRTSRLRYLADRLLEPIMLFPSGYRSSPARVNCTNIVFSLPKFRAIAAEAGWSSHEFQVSRKSVPDGAAKYGSQYGLVLRKP